MIGPIELDARLVEAAVLLAVEAASPAERRAFHQIRDAVYRERDSERREERFRAAHDRFFARFGLGAGLLALLEEARNAGLSGDGIARVVIVPAATAAEEGADLRGEAPPALVIQILARTLLDQPRLALLLRRDLLKVADMLDPAFGYTRRLPSGEAPSHERLIRDRYRVHWDASVDGRLSARGLLPAGARQERLEEFSAAFRSVGSEAARQAFDRLFDGPRPTHDDLCRLALDAELCFLCRLPTRSFHAAREGLDGAIAALIAADNPGWSPGAPICLQCADLYAARA